MSKYLLFILISSLVICSCRKKELDQEKKTFVAAVPEVEQCTPIIISKLKNDSVGEYDLNKKKPKEYQGYDLADSSGLKIKAYGHFHEAEILLPKKHNKKDGYLVIKPFAYFVDTLPSLGSPTWSAYDGILVNCGWISKACASQRKQKVKTYSAYKNINIIGHVKLLNPQHETSIFPSKIIEQELYSSYLIWDLLHHNKNNNNFAPVGNQHMPILIELTN